MNKKNLRAVLFTSLKVLGLNIKPYCILNNAYDALYLSSQNTIIPIDLVDNKGRRNPNNPIFQNNIALKDNLNVFEVSDQHLETIDKYQLLRNLVDSNGIIDEEVLDKLKFNVRSLLESSDIKDKELLDLCLDVIYNQNMKALGLHNLVLLYVDWKEKKDAQEAADAEPDAVND